jgi:glutamyl-Q tRNA(Asp) synthetase
MSGRKPGDALRLDLGRAIDGLEGADLEFTETGPFHPGVHTVHASEAQNSIGDIVLSRKGDGIVAYFLASAFDDSDQNISHVVRGQDLFEFTAIQVILQRLLGLPTPVYHHHALIRDEAGKRLAKRDDARSISTYRAQGATPADIRRMIGLSK